MFLSKEEFEGVVNAYEIVERDSERFYAVKNIHSKEELLDLPIVRVDDLQTINNIPSYKDLVFGMEFRKQEHAYRVYYAFVGFIDRDEKHIMTLIPVSIYSAKYALNEQDIIFATTEWKKHYENVCAYSFPETIRSFRKTTPLILKHPFFEACRGNGVGLFMEYESDYSICRLMFHRYGYQSNVTEDLFFKTLDELLEAITIKLKAKSLEELVN